MFDLSIVVNIFSASTLKNIELIFSQILLSNYMIYKPLYWGVIPVGFLSLIFLLAAFKGLKEDKEERYNFLHFSIIALTPVFLTFFIIYWFVVIRIVSV